MKPSHLTLEVPDWIPASARIVIKHSDEVSLSGQARVGKRPLASLLWLGDGQLDHVKELDSRGKGHGLEIERQDGRVIWCAQWVHGVQHGPVIQFDRRGKPTMVTEFVRGRGTDIWMGCGAVSEVRHVVDKRLHGQVRWGDPRRPWEEEHYRRGLRHGILRRWEDGALRKGFPQFYLDDVQVSRRAYEKAQVRDGSLPRYDPRDDANRRPMPPVVRDALARAKALRRELALLADLQRLGGVRSRSIAMPRVSTSTRRRAPRRRPSTTGRG